MQLVGCDTQLCTSLQKCNVCFSGCRPDPVSSGPFKKQSFENINSMAHFCGFQLALRENSLVCVAGLVHSPAAAAPLESCSEVSPQTCCLCTAALPSHRYCPVHSYLPRSTQLPRHFMTQRKKSNFLTSYTSLCTRSNFAALILKSAKDHKVPDAK